MSKDIKEPRFKKGDRIYWNGEHVSITDVDTSAGTYEIKGRLTMDIESIDKGIELKGIELKHISPAVKSEAIVHGSNSSRKGGNRKTRRGTKKNKSIRRKSNRRYR